MSPRIPEYQRSVGLIDKGPNVDQPLVNPRSYGQEQLAQAELWGQVGKAAGKAADLGFDIEEKMARAKMVDEFSNMNAAYTKGLYELREAVKGGSLQQPDGQTVNFSNDPATWQKSFEEEHQKLLERTLSSATVPGAQLFKRHASMVFPTQLHGIMNDSRKQTVDNVKGNLEANINIYQEMWPKAGSELERTQLWNNVVRSLEEAEATHVITPKQSELMKMKFGKYTKVSDFSGALARDPFAAQEALKHPDAFGFTDKERMDAKNHADAEVRKKQNENYEALFGQFVQNTNVDGTPKGPVPTEDQIKVALKSGQIHAGQAHNLMGALKRSEHNPENKIDRESSMAIATRMTEADPGKLLTREEYLNNVNTGTWKVTSQQYSHDLHEIAARDNVKIPKQLDATLNNLITRQWPNRFKGGMANGKDSEEYQMAVTMIRNAKSDGEYEGLSPKEVEGKVNDVFKTQLHNYQTKAHIDLETGMKMKYVPPKSHWFSSNEPGRWEKKGPAAGQQSGGTVNGKFYTPAEALKRLQELRGSTQ